MLKKLSERHKKFCESYIVTLSQTESYLEVFKCKRTTANSMSSNLMKEPLIKEYINSLLTDYKSKEIAQAEEVLKFLTKVLRSDKARISEKLKASEMLGKRWGLMENQKDQTEKEVVINFNEDQVDGN